jgi:type IX secretion system PorP/SprF family membrane protein
LLRNTLQDKKNKKIKMKRKLPFVLMLLGMINICNAQQDLMISQYMFSGLFINPAYSGSHEFTEVTALYRQQWVSFAGAPTSQIISGEGRIGNKNAGWGGIFSNDKIGVTNKTDLYGNYSYHMKVGKTTTLSLGVRGGASYYRAMLTQLTVWDAQDQVFMSNIRNKFLPNAGAGLYLYSKKFYAGFSAPNILNYGANTVISSSALAAGAPNYRRHYYLNGGYVHEVNSNLFIKPSFLVKYVANAPVEVDVNLNALVNKSFWVGASYRTRDGLVGIIEYQHDNSWRLGYAYDQPLTMLRSYSFGSHEIMFSYMFHKKDALKIKSPRFF